MMVGIQTVALFSMLAVCNLVSCFDSNPLDLRETKTSGFASVARRKRGYSFTAKGALALRHLLAGTKPVESKLDNFRDFHKDGDYVTGLKDFYSVQPNNVKVEKNYIGFTTIEGQVGDRVLKLYEYNPLLGRPVLSIIDLTGKVAERWEKVYTDRIIYTKPIKK